MTELKDPIDYVVVHEIVYLIEVTHNFHLGAAPSKNLTNCTSRRIMTEINFRESDGGTRLYELSTINYIFYTE